MLDIDFCDRCGCPRIVHVDDAVCAHCMAFPKRGVSCQEYLPPLENQRTVTILSMNKDFLALTCLVFWAVGLTFGMSFLGLIVGMSFWYCLSLFLFSFTICCILVIRLLRI